MRLRWGLMLVALAFAGFVFYNPPGRDPVDPWLVLVAGLTALVLVVLLLAVTREWRARTVGLLIFTGGCAVFFIGSYATYRWFPDNQRAVELVNDGVRACFTVAPPLVLIGVATYLVEWRRHRPEQNED